MATLPFLAGLLVALSLAAPPGPMNALIAREASRAGALRGFLVGSAAPIADTIYLAVLAFSFERFLIDPLLLRGAAGAGALLMAYFAWSAVQVAPSGEIRRVGFLGALGIALANPYQIGWWLTGGFHLVIAGDLSGILGFLLGIFLWVAAFAWLCARGAQRWPWFVPAVAVLSADLLAAFAVVLAAKAAGLVP